MTLYDELLDLQLPGSAQLTDTSLSSIQKVLSKIFTAFKLLNQGKHSLFQFGTGATTIAISSTSYIGLGIVAATPAGVEFQVPADCKVRGLFCTAAANITGSTIYTLIVNGVVPTGAPMTTITGATRIGNDTASFIQLYAGDTICIRAVTDGTAAVTTHQITLGF